MKRILLLTVLAIMSVHRTASQNLLTNGDFESGAPGTGFNVSGAGYTQISAPFSGTTVPGNFALTTNPAPMNTTNFIAGTDHGGTGSMLIVDGLGTNAGNPFFWESGNAPGGTICGLTAGHVYYFSYWIKSVSTTTTNAATQADIRLAVTNATAVSLVSGNALAPLPANGWQKVTHRFTASAACVNIGLWNNNTSLVGNDFAIDDLSLVPANAVVSASALVACLNGTPPVVTFTANVGAPQYTFTYNINGGANQTVNSGAATNTATITVPTGASGTFNVNLVSVAYGATTIPQTGTVAVVVNPAMTASIVTTPPTSIIPGQSFAIAISGTPGAVVTVNSPAGTGTVQLDEFGNGYYNIPYIAEDTTFSLVSIAMPTAPLCTTALSGISITIPVDGSTCAMPTLDVSIATPTLPCSNGECTELTAQYSNIGSTTSYVVEPISFTSCGGYNTLPPPGCGFCGEINATGDDTWSPVVNLPFDFSFYGVCYDKVLVGTNGVITFDLVNQQPLTNCPWAYSATIPNPAFPILNAIYGVYQDTDIRIPPVVNPAVQKVSYILQDQGIYAAPNRIFIANFNELPQFQCGAGAGLQSSQIILHEGTNIIEVFVTKRTPCNSWNGGNGLIGVQNQGGTQAIVPPGRNTGNWTTTQEAWRFYPKNVPLVPTEIRWEDGSGPIAGSTNQNPITICPTVPTTYTAIVKYDNCGVAEVRESITVTPAPPLPVNDPVDIPLCQVGPPYVVPTINQTAAMLAGVPNAVNYDITYYEDPDDARYNSGQIMNLNNFPIATALPKTIYVRIEDLNSTGCFNIRPFNIVAPTGTFYYPATPYCNNIPTQQVINQTALTTGGTFAVVSSTPSGANLIIDPATGSITPLGSDPGTYTVEYKIGTCVVHSTTVEIIACSCLVTASSTSETLCINTALTPITYTTVGATSASIFTGSLPPGVTGSFSGGIFTVSGTPTASGVFTYQVEVVSGLDRCYASTTINVTPAASVILTSAPGNANQVVCVNTTPSNIVYTIANATGVNVTGLPAGMTFAFNSTTGQVTISGTPTATGAFNYTVSTTGGCGSASLGGTVTVNPVVTLSQTSAAATTNQTLCVNTPITNITFTTGNGATGVTVLGLPTGVAGVFNSTTNVFTISGTPTVDGTFNYTVTAINSCGTASLGGTIIVNPNVTMALTSAAGTDAQTVCINAPITNIEYTTTNNPTSATVTGLPAGIIGTFAAGVVTISGSTALTGTFNYTVTTSGGCSLATLPGTITVGPAVTLTLTSASATTSQALCVNTPLTNITYAVANNPTTVNVTGLPAGVTGLFNSTTNVFTISGTPTVDGAFSYTVTTSGGCGTDTETGTITVNPDVTLTLTSAAGTDAQTVCTNTPITSITYSTTNNPTTVTVTGLPAGIAGVYAPATGVFTISGSSAATGTFSYTVSTSGGCGTASQTGTITISPDVTIALSSAAGTDAQTVCINTPIVNIDYTTTNNPITVNAIGLPAGVTGNFTGGVYTLSGTPTVDGIFNYTLTTSGGCGIDSITGVITVNPSATIVQTSAVGTEAQTVCINTPINNITYAVGNGANNATVIGLPAGVIGTYVAGIFTISGTPTVDGIFNYTVTTSGGCGTPSLTGIITVDPNVTIALSSAVGTDAQTVCINTPIANIEYTTTNGVTNVTDSGLPPGVTGIFAGGVYTLSGTPTATGVFNYTVTTFGGCSVAVENGTITVDPDATIVQTSAPGTELQTLCINNSITPIVYTVGNGATGASVIGLPAGVSGIYIGGAFTISGTPTVDGIFNYTVTTSGGCGIVSLGGTITVNPDPTVTLTSAAGTDAQVSCINTAIVNIDYTVANGATGASVTGLPAGIIAVFNSATNVVTIGGSTTATGTYNYLVTTSGGCSPASIGGTITINPDVVISLTSAPATASQVLCINTPITNIVYTTVNGATDASTVGLPAGVIGTFAGGVYTLSGTPTVAGSFPYTVTTIGGCHSDSATGIITVNPNATIALTSAAGTNAQTVCINTPIVNIDYTVADGASGATVTGLPAGLTTAFNVATSVLTISGTPSVSGNFSYTINTVGGCAIATLTGTINVNPNVTIVLTSLPATSNQTVCVSTPIASIAYTIANAGPTGAIVTGLPAGVTGLFNSTTNVFTISGTPTAAGNYPYTITTDGGCSSASLTGNILVNPNATLTQTSAAATANQSVCIAQAIVPVTFAIGNGATSASITSGGLPPGITGTFAAGVFTISGSATTSGIFNYQVTTSGGCSSATLPGTIEVKPNVTLLLTSAAGTTNQFPCLSSPIDSITYVPGNGATGATVTGLPPGVTSSFTGGVLTISGAASTLGIFNYTVTTTGGCSTAQLLGRIEVVPNATITLTSAAGTNNQGICVVQEVLTNITYQVGNGATGASVVAGNLPSGISASFAGGILTISGTPTQSGVFNYTVRTTGGCSFATATGTITVHALPVIVLPQDGFICVDQSNNPLPGSTFELTSGLTTATHTFVWSNASGTITGAVGSSYIATAPGVYSVQATNITTGCVNSASTTVITSFPPKYLSAEASTYFAEEQVVTVSVAPVGNYEYQIDNGAWQDSNQFFNLQSGYHTITVRDKVGCGELTTTIRIIDYPKFFTPNSDGYNDFWNIFELADQPQSKIEIFDRYGKLLKEISPMGRGWDGTLNGHLLPSTDYWFKVYYTDENDVPSEFKAHFSLKR